MNVRVGVTRRQPGRVLPTTAAPGGSTYPLDRLTARAAGAWSVSRLLSRSMVGKAIVRLRRSTDQAESDFGATALGLLDETAILNWLGVPTQPLDVLNVQAAALPSAFIVSKYDHSGNNLHATQPVAANQPRLVNAGVFDRRKNRPAAVATSASSGLSFAFNPNGLTSASMQGVVSVTGPATLNPIGLGAQGALLGWNESGGGWGILTVSPSLGGIAWRFGIGQASNPTWARPIAANETIRLTAVKNGTAEQVFVNSDSSPIYNAPAGSLANIATTANLMSYTGNNAMVGNALVEAYWFPGVALSAADRSILDVDQAEFYA